ncbi:MAG TPA: DEAD/DEAH box helicase, partial [Saprospiraceae bacterium]|nr:DEAD/DEAH box helicase [Saprospiraceae bacterium]
MSNYDQHKNEIDRLLAKLGHSSLTAMQQKVFDPLFSGNDVWLTAPTGSGKTLAFLLPLVLRISQQKLRALIIVPTRELAIQTAQVARNLGSGLSVVLSYGGNNRHREILALQRNPDLIIGTPGR